MNNFKEAIEDYESFLNQNENNFTAMSFLSQCYSELNNIEKSIEILTCCIEKILKKKFHKDDKESLKERRSQLNILYKIRGNEYFKLKLFQNSIEDYTNSYSNHRRDFDVLRKRGNCYFELNEFEKSIEDLSFVSQASPTIDTYIVRAKCYKSLNKIQQSINDLIVKFFFFFGNFFFRRQKDL